MDPNLNTQTPQTIQPPKESPEVVRAVNKTTRLVLIIAGVLELIFPAIAIYMLIPFINLQDALGMESVTPYIGVLLFSIIIIIALTQLIVGAFSFDKKLGPQKIKTLIITGLVMAGLTIPAFIYFIIVPIYDTLEIIQ